MARAAGLERYEAGREGSGRLELAEKDWQVGLIWASRTATLKQSSRG